MIGTRGVPARYGGFETAVEEIGQRLVAAGHEVTVYCRGAEDQSQTEYLGMHLVHLPSVRKRALETLSHSAASMMHAVTRRRVPDVVFVFNSANAFLVPLLQVRRIPVAIHVDGLEWKRAKWEGAGQRYYRRAEAFAVRRGDRLISDARAIADYYRGEFGIETDVIAYGATIQQDDISDGLAKHGLTPGGYHLVVARFEPENNVLEIVQGYRRSRADKPLLVVGGAPYSADYTRQVQAIIEDDPRIRALGSVWDQKELDSLYRNAFSYLHGHSVGGTNPSLLRAMGAGTPVLANDVVFNREVLGSHHGRFFATPTELRTLLHESEADPDGMAKRGRGLQRRAERRYSWDKVAAAYEDLAFRLATGESTRGLVDGQRRGLDLSTLTAAESVSPLPVEVSDGAGVLVDARPANALERSASQDALDPALVTERAG